MAWLKSLPGIGEIIATHLVARLGDPELITNVRQIAGFLGLVSSEHSTGDKQIVSIAPPLSLRSKRAASLPPAAGGACFITSLPETYVTCAATR